MLKWFNKNTIPKQYVLGEKVCLKRNKRLGNKFEKNFVEKTVQKDLGTTGFGTTYAKIVDYNSAHIIPIAQGKLAVYNEYIYLVHTTYITDFQLSFKKVLICSRNSQTPHYLGIS